MTILFPLIVYMFLGRYVRYFADDYSSPAILRDYGFWVHRRTGTEAGREVISIPF